MENKVYIVMEIGYEYNDEYMYRPESEGGLPRKTFHEKELAEKYKLELEIEKFRNENLDYFEFSREYLFDETFENINDGRGNINKDATNEHILTLLNNCDLNFYEIIETEIE
jgi:hypothetical protein